MTGSFRTGAAIALTAATMALGSTSALATEPTYACTAETEGHMFHAVADPGTPNVFFAYQCRSGAWRFLGMCESGNCPSPDPGGPIIEM